MIISITGSRSIQDYEWFKNKLNLILKNIDVLKKENEPTSFISGGAKGVDYLIKQYCIDNSYFLQELLPDWNKYGRSAGVIRNKKIIDISDINLIFWDGISKGSKFNIDYCRKNNKNYRIIRYEKI
jgi:hypothetical protein